MKFIVAIATLMTIFGTTSAWAGQMTSAEIQQEIIGQSFEAKRRGMRATITYSANGKASLKTLLFTADGTWRIAGNQLCMNLTSGPRKGENCVTLTDNGDGQYETSDGATLKPVSN